MRSIEVDAKAQLEEALCIAPDAVLLDNMIAAELRRAVAMVLGLAITEVWGTSTTYASTVATAGVDLISIGWLTHSAPILDTDLEYQSLCSRLPCSPGQGFTRTERTTSMRKIVAGKLHGIHVTEANLNYHGSITLDPDHCEAAGILASWQVGNRGNVRATFLVEMLQGARGHK